MTNATDQRADEVIEEYNGIVRPLELHMPDGAETDFVMRVADYAALRDIITQLRQALAEAEGKLANFQQLDREAATYVESVICMRIHRFTGESPYVGWKGLGLALSEELDERDDLRAQLSTAQAALERVKKLVCGELRPNWHTEQATYATRGMIADICDAALSTHPRKET